MHRPSVEVRRDELLLYELGLVGFLQLLVGSTGLVRDLDQLGQEGLEPALVAIVQLLYRLGGPARQT